MESPNDLSDEHLRRDNSIASVLALEGVTGFEFTFGANYCFRLVTIKEGTSYSSLIDGIRAVGINVGGMFLHDPNREDWQWFKYSSASLTFHGVTEGLVSRYRDKGEEGVPDKVQNLLQ